MSALSNYAENKLLETLTLKAVWQPQAPLTVALYTVTPTDASAGTEVSAASYARKTVTFANAAASGAIANSSIVLFDVALQSWGNIAGIAIFDGTGNMLWYSPCSIVKNVATGDQYSLPAGSIVLNMD